jgi:hypothetical protein
MIRRPASGRRCGSGMDGTMNATNQHDRTIDVPARHLARHRH